MSEIDRDLPIDWCPRCGQKLNDKKESTRIKHDSLHHSKTRKEKIGIYITNHILSLIIISVSVLVIFGLVSDMVAVKTSCEILTKEFFTQYPETSISNIPSEAILELESVCAEFEYETRVTLRSTASPFD